jgi:hypothetical protein
MQLRAFHFAVVGVISTLAMGSQCAADTVRAKRYSGTLDTATLKESGYQSVRGVFLKTGDRDHPWQVDTNILGQEWCKYDGGSIRSSAHCVYAIQSVTGRNSAGMPTLKTEDALEFLTSNGFTFLDDEEMCADRHGPNRSILVIARWESRKLPKVGGFASAIRQAWILDPETKRFLEISVDRVTCEVNEDRN